MLLEAFGLDVYSKFRDFHCDLMLLEALLFNLFSL